MKMRTLGISLLAGFAALLSSCDHMTMSSSGLEKSYMAYDQPATRPTNKANVRVKISTSKQMLYVTEGSKVLLAAPVCVGTASTPTPKGNFTVLSKDATRRANTHGWAYNPSAQTYRRSTISNVRSGEKFTATPMCYWVSFASAAYGIHTGYVYPYPKTHGCVRMHHNIAPKFYEMVSVGTPISIATTQPEDSTAGANIPHPPDPQAIPDNPTLECSSDYFKYHKPVQFN